MFSLVHVVTKLTMFLDLRSQLGNCRIVNQLFNDRIVYPEYLRLDLVNTTVQIDSLIVVGDKVLK